MTPDFYNHALALRNYQGGGLQEYAPHLTALQNQEYASHLTALQNQVTSNAYLQGIGQYRPRYSVRAFAVPEWQRGWFYGHSDWAKIP